MMKTSKYSLLASSLLAVTLILSACGGDDDNSSTNTSIVSPDTEETNPEIETPPQTSEKLIGYNLLFTGKYNSNDAYVLADVLQTEVLSTSDNTIEEIEQALYTADSYKDYEPLPNKYIITPTGNNISYKYVSNTSNQLIHEKEGSTFSGNHIIQELDNGVNITETYLDENLAGQRIIDVLNSSSYYGLPDSMVGDFEALPSNLKVFSGNASCKKLESISHGPIDYIEFSPSQIPYNESTNLEYHTNELTNPIQGNWVDIPWSAETARNSNTYYGDYAYDALVKFDGNVVYSGYYKTGVHYIDKSVNKCDLYNEAAKDQILKAVNTVYPTL